MLLLRINVRVKKVVRDGGSLLQLVVLQDELLGNFSETDRIKKVIHSPFKTSSLLHRAQPWGPRDPNLLFLVVTPVSVEEFSCSKDL